MIPHPKTDTELSTPKDASHASQTAPRTDGGKGRFATYRELAKSGIVTLVLISVLAGYWIGQSIEAQFDFLHLIRTLGGVLGLAAGSSALNQVQERNVDAQMPRTASRPLPSGRLSLNEAYLFIILSLTLGLALLASIDPQVLLLGAGAVVSYNGLYTLWWKRKWAYAAVPGAIPGALPILMGYAAAHGSPWTPAGLYLFFVLFYWQMPHFWALALRFEKDYAFGNFPTLPVSRGAEVTRFQIGLWGLCYVGLAALAPLFLRTGSTYVTLSLAMSLKVLWELRAYLKQPDSRHWLRFFLWINFSLIVYLAAAVLDLWGHYLLVPLLTR
jgi:protoheme IX farnesyltransferase